MEVNQEMVVNLGDRGGIQVHSHAARNLCQTTIHRALRVAVRTRAREEDHEKKGRRLTLHFLRLDVR